MDDLTQRIGAAARRLDPGWDEARLERTLARAQTRLRRRRLVRGGIGVAAPLLVLVGLILLGSSELYGPGAAPPAAVIATNPPGERAAGLATGALYFADGSLATPLEEGSTLIADEVTSTNVAVRLERGAARFEVTPRPRRLFRVRAGPVSVLVLGTVFTVDRRDGRVAVEVERGRVRVAWDGGAQVVEAGGRALFPPGAPEPGDGPSTPLSPRSAAPAQRVGHPATTAASAAPEAPDWQDLADQGRYAESWRALRASGRPPQGMEELLLAADVARLSGHPGEAIRWLERAVEDHPGDPRASVAAFILGRVLLGQAGRPGDAARAFARARQLSPRGALAEDALAREVEAWSRAGAAELARQRAQVYLQRYPGGRRARAVRRFGGLE